ncbi:MAG: bifunctional glutamate N-acetyltransferase/amino-acid acetyltransferase ArgJ [Pseudomonadota bacterium]
MAVTKTSPFAPEAPPVMPQLRGVSLVSVEAGIRYKGRKDLLLAVLPPQTVAAGVTTQSATRSAAVNWCRNHLKRGNARALVVNAGNANAFTGQRGIHATELTAMAAAGAVGCKPEDVFLASTGVIGEPMDVSGFSVTLTDMARGASEPPTQRDWLDAAAAIMTTDTYPKLAAKSFVSDEQPHHVAGIAKGSGMIAPDMATMLAFVFTDVAIDVQLLRDVVRELNAMTFNCVTVDGDTSTSDTFLVFATGQAGTPKIAQRSDPRFLAFRNALHAVMRDLALQIAKDGEGITKFVTIAVKGAEHVIGARKIALSIANSPLVKTAIAGSDPNWGRIVMAVGKSGAHADRDKLSIAFGPHIVAEAGERAANYNEEIVAQYMRGDHIDIAVDVGVGSAAATVWTCDLTHDYISINADYRS